MFLNKSFCFLCKINTVLKVPLSKPLKCLTLNLKAKSRQDFPPNTFIEYEL